MISVWSLVWILLSVVVEEKWKRAPPFVVFPALEWNLRYCVNMYVEKWFLVYHHKIRALNNTEWSV